MSDLDFVHGPLANGVRSAINGIAQAAGLGPERLEVSPLEHDATAPYSPLRAMRMRVSGARAAAQLHTLTSGALSLAHAAGGEDLAPTTYPGHAAAQSSGPRRQAGRTGPLGYRIPDWLTLGGARTTGTGEAPPEPAPGSLMDLLRPCKNCGGRE